MRHCTLAAACVLLLGLAGEAGAQERPANGKPPDAAPQELERLQQRIDEMRDRHAAEITRLEARIRQLEAPQEEQPPGAQDAELEELRRLAAAEAATEAAAEKEQDATFKIAGLSLQALNPEISLVGDVLATCRYQDKIQDRADFEVRTLGIHFESYLDPYSRMKVAIPVTEKFAKLGEAYLTRFAVLDGLNLTVGKFRQSFGLLNRWHQHGLDQVDFPLALKRIFGDGGLNQTGLSVDWTLPPLGTTAHELTLQVTNGENERLFSGNTLSTPAVLARYHGYRDLSPSTYLDVGFTALAGWNDEWELLQGSTVVTEERSLPTWVFGADLTLVWEPTNRMRYRNLEWRTELYFVHRTLLAPDDGRKDTLDAWGAYTYVQSRLARDWIAGVRLDYYKPDGKRYAGQVPSVAGLAAAHDDAFRWGVAPYVTWHQSPFVHVRLEYDHLNGKGLERPEHLVMLQVIFAAGPHKHERY
ncbi:MAG: hypothetical protein JXQ29_10970 [Planctomycetes bacterium]|nr:hypothetical protein [Planctomycetota bacterium]